MVCLPLYDRVSSFHPSVCNVGRRLHTVNQFLLYATKNEPSALTVTRHDAAIVVIEPARSD